MARPLALTSDLLYAVRRLKNAPAFSLTAVVLLAVGIASNVAVFRLIGALFLRPISVEKPAELVDIASLDRNGQIGGIPSSVLESLRHEPVFQGLCGFSTPRLTTEINGGVASTGSLAMTGDCFRTLGLKTQIGREAQIYFWASIFARRAAGVSKEEVAARIKVLQKQLLEQRAHAIQRDATTRLLCAAARCFVCLDGRRLDAATPIRRTALSDSWNLRVGLADCLH
ncbi:MAG TPA: hypothetical protein VGL97_00625 [Bryobacteraceae bacterium]|jgi:hypothetical protein